MKRLLVGLVLFVMACVSAPKTLDSAGETGMTQQKVVAHLATLDPRALGGFARAGEDPLTGPVFLVISDQGYGCIVSGFEFAQINPGDIVECRWRARRPT